MAYETTASPGMIYVFTGEGKGKTSAALGTLVRALSNGWTVGWVSWYKEASWGISEHSLETLLLPEVRNRLKFFSLGKGFYIPGKGDTALSEKTGKKAVRANAAVILDDDTEHEHRLAAKTALATAKELLPEVDVLVLDEVCNAVSDGLLEFAEVEEILQGRGATHVVLTGRAAPPQLIELADLVSEIVKRKHPYDVGKLAVKGLDF